MVVFLIEFLGNNFLVNSLFYYWIIHNIPRVYGNQMQMDVNSKVIYRVQDSAQTTPKIKGSTPLDLNWP